MNAPYVVFGGLCLLFMIFGLRYVAKFPRRYIDLQASSYATLAGGTLMILLLISLLFQLANEKYFHVLTALPAFLSFMAVLAWTVYHVANPRGSR